ncbi:thioredoxin fold domain-containing protein [candidate division GN15 bacterium]|nr:thioredoxin fold domain-containing protein [candidate division GN15 bacterium]
MMHTRVTILTALLAMALITAGCSEKSGPAPLEPVYSDIAQAQEAARTHKLPLLMDFYTDECKWCKKLDTTVLNTAKAEEYFTTKMVLAKVNAHEQEALADKYSVSAFPTLVLLDTAGGEIDRIVGYREEGPFFSTLDDYLQGKGTLAFLVERYEAAPNRILAKKIADKYKYRSQIEQAYKWYREVIATGEPTDSMSAEAKMEMADMERRAGNYDEAILQFEALMNEFAGKQTAEDAELWRAFVLMKKADTTAALTAFKQFLNHYPNSDEVNYARTQIRNLSGQGVQE